MIAGNLEYVMSSLPYLSFQDAVEERSKVLPILKKYAGASATEKSIAAILDEEAHKFLNPKDYRLFQQISFTTIHTEAFRQSKNKVLAAFSNFSHSLKKDLEQLRILRKKGTDPSTVKNPPLPSLQGNPLEVEVQLLKLQWDKLEELSIGHYTDFGALCLYKLKLLLLLRWWSFDQKEGFDNFLNSTKGTEHGR